jgi:elongator complex protein 3
MKKNVRVQPENENEKKACEDIIKTAVKKKVKTARALLVLKKNACEKYKIGFVSNPLLLNTYKDLINEKQIKANDELFQVLRKRRIRTSSGIASVAVLTKPYPCPGKCIYCPTQKGAPKSYIDNEPAVMRAILAEYDPVKQIQIRLRGFELAGNPADKIELIVMGGTWSYLPTKYQIWFILGCFMAANNYKAQSVKRKMQNNSLKLKNLNQNELMQILRKEQKKNECAKYRIIGLTLETRPDFINQKEIKFMRELGCTRVEIGVQSIYDDVLKKNNRGHLVSETVRATKLLKDAGLKICYHMMPNLYGSTYKKDVNMFKTLFSDERFQPDMIKIYPCVVTKYAILEKLFKEKKYIPYTDEELIKLLIEIKKDLPEYVRVQRLIRDIPKENIIGGSTISNLRQIIQEKYQEESKSVPTSLKLRGTGKKSQSLCNCIRCREIREEKKLPVKLKRIDYSASDRQEIFIQYVDKDNKLYALLRLRIPSNLDQVSKVSRASKVSDVHWIPELSGCAIIRELHTYGPMLEVGTKSKKDPQHTGLGRKLIEEAEKITKDEFGLSKIAVISGIGVRGYYKKFGYRLVDTYLIKKII